jgi:ABC-type dipeptide/oligopeptide/nickel transport system permease subunit
MEFLLVHWHCIIPVIAIAVVVLSAKMLSAKRRKE